MKILNVIWAFSTGGIGKLFLTYADLGTCDPELEMISVCIDLQNCVYDREPLRDSNIRIIPIKNRRDFSWIKGLDKIANEVKPDMIFCHGFNGPIISKIAALKCENLRIPMVCTYHGLYNPPTFGKRPIANIINKLQAWMYKKYATSVILVAKYSGEYLIKQGVPEDKMAVIYNGIAEKIPVGKPVQLSHSGIGIGFAGRLDAIKGLRYLIDAIPLIVKHTNLQFHIYIIGDGPEKGTLLNQVETLGVQGYISFEGYQDNIAQWLDSWDVFCLPSLQENHSIALLEAMRAGKAIVCTNVGGNPETVEHDKEAIVISPKNSAILADSLTKVICSPEFRNRLGKNAKARFENSFTEDIMKKKLCEILKSAMR